MATINKFEDLEIWKEARRLNGLIFQITNNDFFRKDFKFKSQVQAASGSAIDNIAEGFERSSRLAFINFLSIAKGSCGEVKSQLYRSFDQLSGSIAGFISYLNKTGIRGQKFKDRT